MNVDDHTAPLLGRLDALATTADRAARQSGLGYWSVAPTGDVHCEGYEDDPAWRVATVVEDVGNRHVAEHIAQNDPVTVLAITHALQRITRDCAGNDAEGAMVKIRAAVAQLAKELRDSEPT